MGDLSFSSWASLQLIIWALINAKMKSFIIFWNDRMNPLGNIIWHENYDIGNISVHSMQNYNFEETLTWNSTVCLKLALSPWQRTWLPCFNRFPSLHGKFRLLILAQEWANRMLIHFKIQYSEMILVIRGIFKNQIYQVLKAAWKKPGW